MAASVAQIQLADVIDGLDEINAGKKANETDDLDTWLDLQEPDPSWGLDHELVSLSLSLSLSLCVCVHARVSEREEGAGASFR